MLNNVWASTISTVASLTGAQILAGTSPDAFASWPLSAQASFVRAYATTPSGAVLIGSSGNQAVATLAASGEVLLTPVPANFNSTPDGVDYNSFTSWSEDLQSFYVQTQGTSSGGAASATLGAPGRQFTATVSPADGAVSVAASAGLLAAYTGGTTPTPASLTASAFFALPEDEQKLILARNGSPLTLAGAGADAQAIPVRLADGTSFTMNVPAGTYPGFGDALDTSNTAGVAISDATAFRSWPAEVQKGYLRTVAGTSGYPLALVFGVAAEEVPAGASAASTASDGFTALLAAADAGVVVSDNPSGFGRTLTGFAAASSGLKPVAQASAPAAADFLAWPAAAQVAYVRSRGGTAALTSPASGTLTATVSAPAGLTLAVAAPTAYPAPADLDLDLFALWPAGDQTKYIAAKGSGSPASLTVTSAAGTAVLTANGTKAATVEIAPAGYASKPADLAPSIFLSWSDDWRRAYVAQNGGDVTMGGHLLTIGSDLQQIQVAYAGGQLQITTPPLVDLSPSDLAAPTGAEVAASTTTSAFGNWSRAAQTSFIKANGVGTPPSVLIGPPGAQQIWTVDATGNLEMSTVPPTALTINADPADIALSDVQGWPTQLQSYYVLRHGTNGSLIIGSGASATTLKLSSDGTSVTSNGSAVTGGPSLTATTIPVLTPPALTTLLATDPAKVDADTFARVPAADQAAYFAAKASGTPPTLTIGSSTLLTMAAGAVAAQALPVDFNTKPTALSATTFLSWSADVRRLYVQRESAAQANAGTAAQVVIGTDATVIAALGSDGQVAVSLPIPYKTIGDTTDTSAAATAVLLFPLANGGSAAGTTPTRPAGFYSTPASLDPTAFAQWSSTDQAAYIRLNAGSQSYLTVGTGTSAIDAFIQSTPATGTPPKVYIVQQLQKTDVTRMSYADQRTLSGIPDFSPIAVTLGLLTDGDLQTLESGTTATTARDYVAGLISTARNSIAGTGSMSFSDQAVFLNELDLLSAQLLGSQVPTQTTADLTKSPGAALPSAPVVPSAADAKTGSAIFSPNDIQNQIKLITDRFDRASKFGAVANRVSTFTYTTISPASGGPQPSDLMKAGLINHSTLVKSDGSLAPYIVITSARPGGVFAVGDLASAQAAAKQGSGTLFINGTSYSLPIVVTSGTFECDFGTANSTSNFDILTASINDYYTLYDTRTTMSDNDASIASGYNTFMAQERTILNAALAIDYLATNGSVGDTAKTLDVPSLICQFQLYASASQQAVIKADTEETNQLNKILQDYAAMQQIINKTLGDFTTSSDSSKPDKENLDTSGADANIIAMFDSGQNNNNQSPSEILAGISSRPRIYLASTESGDDNKKESGYFSNFANSLNGAVTTLNQQSQIKMNDITSENKMLDRYTQMATDTLSKANDMVSKIASAG